MEEHDNKKRTAVWLTPGVIRRMDGWLEEDNCKTRSEFIEKALRFYMENEKHPLDDLKNDEITKKKEK